MNIAEGIKLVTMIFQRIFKRTIENHAGFIYRQLHIAGIARKVINFSLDRNNGDAVRDFTKPEITSYSSNNKNGEEIS